MKKTKILLTVLPIVLMLSSCTGKDDMKNLKGFSEVNYQLQERDRYDNIFGEENIPDQWSDYGIGDPYVMRFNGEYYLYASTKNFEYGYRVWKSHDLIHYSYLGEYPLTQADGSTTGLHTAYAPEVIYWNGDFYMYSSPDGKGHYIFKSVDRQPFGEFRAVTSNIGLSIDGSVFIDDDEKMYFMAAGDGAITSYEMNSPTEIDNTSGEELYSPLVKWTEGPYMIKHDDNYFLTYTGNHVKSRGYRVDYSFSSSPRTGFEYPSNNSLLLSSMGEQNGLGHSSTVLGPNLDSYYIAYHNLDSASGPVRSFNINRLTFSGTRMNVLGPTYQGAMVPMMPEFYVLSDNTSLGEKEGSLEESNGSYYSSLATADTFSVEYNFKDIKSDGSSKFLFGVNGTNSGYATIDGKSINVYYNQVLVAQGSLIGEFDFTQLHTLRLSYGNQRLKVAFDNLTKIDSTISETILKGKIGYSGMEQSSIGTTTFANAAFDSSQSDDAKIVGSDWFATDYLKDISTIDSQYTLDHDINDDRLIYSEANGVRLSKSKDKIVFPIDVLEDGFYGIENTYSMASIGSKITIQIDNNLPYLVELPGANFANNYGSYEENLTYIKNLLLELPLTKGLHTIKFELVSGKYESLYYNTFADSEFSPNFENDLSDYVSQGSKYMTLWKIDEQEQAHYSKAGSNNMLLFGSEGMTDYEVSVKVKITMDSSNGASAGIMLRTLNPSIMSGQVNECAEGYLVTFNNMQLVMERMNYNGMTVASLTGDFTLNVYHEMRAICKGNNIKVYFDGEYAFEYTDPDPFTHGMVGLYSISAESYYKDLKITGVK